MLENNLINDNSSVAFNNFSEVPRIPYKILEILLGDNDDKITENTKYGVPTKIAEIWKMLKYNTNDCLEQKFDKKKGEFVPIKKWLTFDERKAMIWDGSQADEGQCSLFLKPLIGTSLNTAEMQTQIRLYRISTMPINQYEGVLCYEFDIITNERTCLVERNKELMERTDLIENTLLSVLNGRDIGVGTGYLTFNKELTRSCGSMLNINNSKTLYGRSIVFGLDYASPEVGGICG